MHQPSRKKPGEAAGYRPEETRGRRGDETAQATALDEHERDHEQHGRAEHHELKRVGDQYGPQSAGHGVDDHRAAEQGHCPAQGEVAGLRIAKRIGLTQRHEGHHQHGYGVERHALFGSLGPPARASARQAAGSPSPAGAAGTHGEVVSIEIESVIDKGRAQK